jgi:hypothetical protein
MPRAAFVERASMVEPPVAAAEVAQRLGVKSGPLIPIG